MVKVQVKRITDGEKRSAQFWIPLPEEACESLKIEEGTELEVFVELGGLVCRKVETGAEEDAYEKSIKKFEGMVVKLAKEGKLSEKHVQLAEEVVKKSRKG